MPLLKSKLLTWRSNLEGGKKTAFQIKLVNLFNRGAFLRTAFAEILNFQRACESVCGVGGLKSAPNAKLTRSTVSCLPSYNLQRWDATALAVLVRLLKHVFIAEVPARQHGASPRKHLNALVRHAVSAPLYYIYPLRSDAFCYPLLPANTLGSSATRDNFWSKSNGFQFTDPKPKVRFRRNEVKSFWIKCISPLDRWLML